MTELWTRNKIPIKVLVDDNEPLLPQIRATSLLVDQDHEGRRYVTLAANGRQRAVLARLMLGAHHKSQMSVTYRNGDFCDLRRANLVLHQAPRRGELDYEDPADDLATRRLVREMMLRHGPMTEAELDAYAKEILGR